MSIKNEEIAATKAEMEERLSNGQKEHEELLDSVKKEHKELLDSKDGALECLKEEALRLKEASE